MSRIAVVAYPVLSAQDQQWIESVRRSHDPQALHVRAHFTILFPCDAVPDVVLTNMRAAAASAGLIPFQFRQSEAVPDSLRPGGHVFLLPDERASTAIAALHDRLCTGALVSYLREDIPFRPHLTVAAKPDVESCANLVRECSERCRDIRGTIDAIELVDVESSPVSTLDRCLLRGS